MIDNNALPRNGRVVLTALQDGDQVEAPRMMSGRYEVGGVMFDE